MSASNRLQIAATLRLCLIQRHVGVLQQRVGVHLPIAGQGDADAGADDDRVAGERV